MRYVCLKPYARSMHSKYFAFFLKNAPCLSFMDEVWDCRAVFHTIYFNAYITSIRVWHFFLACLLYVYLG